MLRSEWGQGDRNAAGSHYKHVKEQNWFAVLLDFIIVVLGIWLALIAGQWVENRQDRADLRNTEHDINAEVQGSYK